MTLMIYAPSREGAAMLARRVRPHARIGDIVEQSTPANQETLAAFWEQVKRLTARSASEIRAHGITVRKLANDRTPQP